MTTSLVMIFDKAAMYRILKGRNRQEQEAFIAFRSYCLFESNYCTRG